MVCYSYIKLLLSYNMPARITVMLEDEVVKKLRIKQSKLIQESNKAISFSHVINEALKANLKGTK